MNTYTLKSESLKSNMRRKKNVESYVYSESSTDITTNGTMKWYQEVSDDAENFLKISDKEIEILKSEAKQLLNDETHSYTNKTSKGGKQFDYTWMRTVMNKGTASDKIAANTILVQDSPVHNLATLRNLTNLVKVGKKNECLMIIDTLIELFLSDLLPPHRKLKVFEARPHALLDEFSCGNKDKRQKYLLHWYFEDQLKELYKTFIQSLQSVSHDSVDKNKEKAVTAFYKLLKGNPEQENVLLSNIVNKLGDPSQKVVSKVIYSLIQLLHVHPNMKGVVAEEIEKLLFRPNVRQRAQYYGLCFLTQLIFTDDETPLAVTLIKLYLSFFKACVKKGEVDSRMMSALFTGVNRAYPFARNEISTIIEHIDTLYKVVHIASFNVSLHALCLLFHVTDCESANSGRYYAILYKKLLDPHIGCSSRQAMFLNLLFRSLQKDISVSRVRVFIKRLLQLCLYWPVPLVCGVLYMISQFAAKKTNILTIEMTHAPTFESDGSDDEHYDDVKEEEKGHNIHSESETQNHIESEKVKRTWYHCQIKKEKNHKASKYNPFHRNPMFSGGEHSICTELCYLVSHYHPTVSLFARQILLGEKIVYSGDPLQDFSLSSFLERFVFKNPKKGTEKSSVMVHSRFYAPSGVRSLAVTSANYLNTDESKIPVDELFLYSYLKKKRKEKRVSKDSDSDVESVASEEFQEMIDNMMGVKKVGDFDFADEIAGNFPASKKKVSGSDGGDDDDDYDSDMSGDDDLDATVFSDEDIAVDENIAHSGGDSDDEDDEANGDEDKFSILDDNEEDLVFDDSFDDDDDDISGLQEEIKRKTSSFKVNKKRNDVVKKRQLNDDTFVSAEEFAEILEETGTSDPNSGSISAMSNRDNADMKQLKWESKRDVWLRTDNKWKRKFKGKLSGSSSKRRKK